MPTAAGVSPTVTSPAVYAVKSTLQNSNAARLKLDETRLELSRAGIQRDQIASQLKFAETALLDAKIALQTDQAAANAHALGEKSSPSMQSCPFYAKVRSRLRLPSQRN